MIKSKLREEFTGLSEEELLQKAYDLGFNFEKNSTSCSQSTVAAIHEMVEMDDVVVRVACSSCGGQARDVLGTCGAVVGATIALDYFFGRPVNQMSYKKFNAKSADAVVDSSVIAKEINQKFIEKWGNILCPYLQTKQIGRHFYFWDTPDPADIYSHSKGTDLDKFRQAGGGTDPDKCSHFVGSAARWVMEILLTRGAVTT